MKPRIYSMIVLMIISVSLFAQKKTSDFITTGDENYSIINISRSANFQEWYSPSKLLQELYINDQPVCEISFQSRISIKVFSEGNIKLSIKYLPNKKIKQKTIDRQFLSGSPLEIDITHGKTYFANVDTKMKNGAIMAFFTCSLVTIPESEAMYNDEDRYKDNPEIKEYQEDINNAFIK